MLQNNERLMEVIAEMSKEYDVNNPVRLDKKLVHKAEEQNILVSDIKRVPDSEGDHFVAMLCIDLKHPFFFEHPKDHVPGLMFIEGGRQVGTAMAHMFYDVPFNMAFVLSEMNVRFYKFADINRPVFVSSILRNKVFRKGKLTQMEHEGVFIQGGDELAFLGGSWHMFDEKIIERMRRSKTHDVVSLEQ